MADDSNGQQRSPKPVGRKTRRFAARLAAVQALYQIEVSGGTADGVLREFLQHRLDSPEAADTYAGADRNFFADVVRGADARHDELERMIQSALAESRGSRPLDRVLLAILRAGAYEIFARPDVPPRAAITDYVDVAHAFFDGRESGVVNGVLDRLARTVRPDEMGSRGRSERR